MITTNDNYFTNVHDPKAHFIIIGKVTDLYCSDILTLRSFQMELHDHLKSIGYDAVIFYDIHNTMYTFDTDTYYFMNNGHPLQRRERVAQTDQKGRPGGRGRSVFTEEQETVNAVVSGSLNMGRMYSQSAWMQIVELLKNRDVSTAIVFDNIDSIQGQSTNNAAFEQMILALENLEGIHGSDPSKPQSSAFYIFTCNSLCQLMNNSLRGASPGWVSFYETILRPRIASERTTAEGNRVINIGTPNAAEIRNLLNYMRLRSEDRIEIEPGDLQELAITLAHYCARKGGGYGISDLLNAFVLYYHNHNDRPIRLDDWKIIMHDEHYKPALDKLNELVGMEKVKESIEHIRITFSNNAKRGIPRYSSRLRPPEINSKARGNMLNLVFAGSPGTGKTTIGRLMGEIYYDLGVLPQGNCILVMATEITNAQDMDMYFQQALGGVLFIDEAYGLMQSYRSQQIITQLVGNMSVYEGQIAVILAGYTDEMRELMDRNSGLKRRFPDEGYFEFENYTPIEMEQIIKQMANSDHSNGESIELTDELLEVLPVFCENWTMHNGLKWGNGGEAETLLFGKNGMKASYRRRIGGAFDGVYRLSPEDIPMEFQEYIRKPAENMRELYVNINSMIGLHSVKAFLKGLADRLLLQDNQIEPGRYIFYGPPGTGKTTSVERICEMLFLLKVIKRRRPVIRTTGELMTGNPRENLRKAVREARGSVLFIDEAHQLVTGDGGPDVIDELITQIEDPAIRSDTGFILAGYPLEMTDLLNTDPGLNRRFPENCRLRFENYTAEELTQILKLMLEKTGQKPDDLYLKRSQIALEKYLEHNQSNDRFGNGGYIRDNYIPQSIRRRAERLKNKYGDNIDGEVIMDPEVVKSIPEEEKITLTGADIPVNMEAYAGSPDAPVPAHRTLETRLSELYGKEEIVNYINSLRVRKDHVVFMDDVGMRSLHFAISGPTGSGRSTAAKVMAEAWKELGFLERNHVQFAGKGDLEAGYVGQTAIKTNRLIAECLDGTLVIVNPSSLLKNNNDYDNTFGPEALGEITSAMSNYADRLSVIFIDSENGMKEFLKQFPDIRSKLSREFLLDDLSPGQMRQLFSLKTRDSFVLEDKLDKIMPDFFVNWVSDRGGLKGDEVNGWGNGIEIEKIIAELKDNWKKLDGGIVTRNGMPCRLITMDMFGKNKQRYLKSESSVSEDAIHELDSYPGFDGIQESLKRIRRRIKYMDKATVTPGVYCYIGNPGTGKTTVAHIMGRVLRAAGALSQGHVISRTARDIATDPQGFDKLVKLARNGILFIDEAHQLATFRNGIDIIKRILTVIEDVEVMHDTCIILAGYPEDMNYLLQKDSGLQSRFDTADSMIFFRDYTPEELMMIAERMTSRANEYKQISCSFPLIMSEGFRENTMKVFEEMCASGDKNFGNARFVRNYIHDAVSELLERVENEHPNEEIDMNQFNVLQKEDVPHRFRRIIDRKRVPSIIMPSKINTLSEGKITDDSLNKFMIRFSEAVVYLEVKEHGNLIGSGTGFIVSKDGYILTCEHVGQNQNIEARIRIPGMPGGDMIWRKCILLKPTHKDCDMALLKLEGENYPYVNIRPASEIINRGERTMMIGYPLGNAIAEKNVLEPSAFYGRVSSVQQLKNGIQRCMINSEGKQGNSGSPVFSLEDGRVIGVFSGAVAASGDYAEELNYFTPIRYFWERFVKVTNVSKDIEGDNV